MKTTNRIKELDYLKCVFIILMIVFHLVYISDKYPYAKNIVYTFHMSAFLLISGYLVNIQKNTKVFFRDIMWIFIPYMFMEIGYVVMSAILPVRKVVHELTLGVVLHKVFIAPMGPYWFLHTLVLCNVVYFLVYKYIKANALSRLIMVGLVYFLLSYGFHLLSLSNAIYFLVGIALFQSGQYFLSIFQPSLFAIIPFTLLCLFPSNLDRSTLGGFAITYLCISFLLFLYTYFTNCLKRFFSFIGQHTLIILLFSPVFTILSKSYLPLFSFDPSGILFMIVSVIFVVIGCLFIAFLIDKLHLSKLCFGKERLLRAGDLNDEKYIV